MMAVPYFATNDEWYKTVPDPNKKEICGTKFILTDKAPKEAIDSYNEYYKELEEIEREAKEKGCIIQL